MNCALFFRALALLGWLLPDLAVGAAEVSVVVDTAAQTLEVRSGPEILYRVPRVAIGSGGAAANRRRGDSQTPLGIYQVAYIKPSKAFGTFLGLDYPRREHVEEGFKSGLLNAYQYQRLIDAIDQGELPPQDTPLGGMIGIHGVGRGNPRLHAVANWTAGCVAVTNEQLGQLMRWVEVGTEVVIR